jgi:hypothetical protein
MDTQDTNLPQNKEELEEEMKAVPTAETSQNETASTITEQIEKIAPKEETVPIAEDVPAATDTTETKEEIIESSKPNEDEQKTSDEQHSEKEQDKVIIPKWKTKEEIIDRLKVIAADQSGLDKQELDSLKQSFYKMHRNEQEAKKLKFIEDGGKEEDFKPEQDPMELEFKTVMSTIKEYRNAIIAKMEKEKEDNLARKLTIIEKIKTFVESPEDANKVYNEFKRLQQEWNSLRHIPEGKANELWHSYQIYVEKFYDILKINKDFRDYDFKKNLEIKTKLCESAEKLEEEPDVISAFHQLQKFHQEFRDTGPVAKDLREAIWTRFKTASTAINKRHQEHFEERKEQEQNNLDAKTVICEIVESIEYDNLKSFANWDEKTQEIIKLQAKWKSIGYAPIKMNTKIFERFRTACDEFFKRKSEFFKTIKSEMNTNLAKKRDLCERAEALKDSTDWKDSTEKLVDLQKEWKTVGSVSKKYSDTVWKRFIAACDYFFEQKKKNTSSQHPEEIKNLEAKKEIIEQVKALGEDKGNDTINKIKDLLREFNAIGHVPFKEKDKLYKEFHDLIDKQFDRLKVSDSIRNVGNFKSAARNNSRSGGSPTNWEREKLVRLYESLKNDIKTFENNLGFLSSSSKNGNSLVTELNLKMDKLKTEMQLVLQKIKAIDENGNQPQEEYKEEELTSKK